MGEDKSESKSTEIAVDYARKRAVYLAVRKLGFGNASKIAASIPPKDLAQIVRGATVLQSKRVGEKTYAQVSVSIADEALRRLLNVKDTPSPNSEITAHKSRNILVLPVLVLPEKTHVWGKDNSLRTPLSIELMRQSHGTVILPGGDLQDLRLIDAENMKTVTTAEMKPMFERYGADEILIAIATPGAEGSEDPSTVLLRRLSLFNPRSEALSVAPEKAEDKIDARLNQLAHSIATVATEIATSTAAGERARLDAATKIKVHFAYAIPREMAHIQQAIQTAPGVILLELPKIALNDITGTIYLEGDVEAVRNHLSKKGVIVRGNGANWTVSTR